MSLNSNSSSKYEGPVYTTKKTNLYEEPVYTYEAPKYEYKIGDTVQIKPGAIDITTRRVITNGDLYVEDSGSWGKIEGIIKDFKPNASLGLGSSVTAIQIGNGSGKIMRTVQVQDIASNAIRSSNTQLALTALSPLTSAVNARNLAAVNNIVNSSSNILYLTGNSKAANAVSNTWAKAMAIDSQLASEYNNIETVYNLIKNLFGIGEQTQKRDLLGTLGAIKEIQNYTSTTQLLPRVKNSSTGNSFLDRLMGIVGSVNNIKDSIQMMTGTYQSPDGAGVISMNTGQMVLPINALGQSSGTYKTVSTAVNQTSNMISSAASRIDSYYSTYNNASNTNSIKAASVSEAKTRRFNNTKTETTENYPKRDLITANETGQNVTGYRLATNAEIANIGIMNPNGLRIATNIQEYSAPTVPELSKDLIINNFPTTTTYGGRTTEEFNLIQNAYGYPQKIGTNTVQNLIEKALNQKSSRYKTIEYDYRIDLDDSRYEIPSGISLEDQLMKVRTALGLQVHGNRTLGKAIKYFLYNRYQNIDGGNLAFNRLITHVFFTRPDLNLLYNGSVYNNQPGVILDEIKRFSDAFLIWQRNPNIFRLLTDCHRTGEPSPNNFNFLLSNQVTNIEFKDETIETVQSTSNWKDYKIEYGGSYKNRGNGEIQCTFLETDDLAVLDLMKMWTMYIDNVTIGTWKPSYNLKRATPNDKKVSVNSPFDSHIYTRTLDYAASCYAFKLAPDGEEILYWTKYYGLIPKSFTLNQLNYSKGETPNAPIQITVSFAYSFKKDLSPISLLEFNKISNIDDSIDAKSIYEPNFDTMHDTVDGSEITNRPAGVRSGVPLVGAPFVAIQSVRDSIVDYGTYRGLQSNQDFKLMLKFKPVPNEDNNTSKDSTFNYKNIYGTNIFSSNSRYSDDHSNSFVDRLTGGKTYSNIDTNPISDYGYYDGNVQYSHPGEYERLMS